MINSTVVHDVSQSLYHKDLNRINKEIKKYKLYFKIFIIIKIIVIVLNKRRLCKFSVINDLVKYIYGVVK